MEIRNTNQSNNNSSSGGIGFCGLLTILFIALKLTGYIAWSWWWIFAPIWIPLVVALSLVIIGFIVILILGD